MNLTHVDPTLADLASAASPNSAPKQINDLRKTITMAQIAKRAGVSQGAISSLLNDRNYGIRLSDKTRLRVFKVCREMGYIPNDLRAIVRTYPELGEYCVLVSSRILHGIQDPHVQRILGAIVAALPDRSRTLTFGSYTSVSAEQVPPPMPTAVRAGICSKFISFGPANHPISQTLRERDLPLVQIGDSLSAPGVLSLIPDYAAASHLAIEYLHQLGHRDIGIVSGPFGATDRANVELSRGVHECSEKLGFPGGSLKVIYSDLSARAGRTAFEDLLSRQPIPSAIFCLSDAAASGLLAAALARGIRVPEELSVVGCGDDPGSEWTHPALTTIRLPAEEIGKLAVEEIDRLVLEKALPPPETRIFPVRLVERGSCAKK